MEYKNLLQLNDDEICQSIEASKAECLQLLAIDNLTIGLPKTLFNLGLKCHVTSCIEDPTLFLVKPIALFPSFLVFLEVGIHIGRAQAERAVLEKMTEVK